MKSWPSRWSFSGTKSDPGVHSRDEFVMVRKEISCAARMGGSIPHTELTVNQSYLKGDNTQHLCQWAGSAVTFFWKQWIAEKFRPVTILQAGFGYLGSTVAELLARTGYDLTIIRRQRPTNRHELFPVFTQDLVQGAAQVPENSYDVGVFILAPQVRATKEYEDTFRKAQEHFLRSAEFKHYVFISSTAVYPEDPGTYEEKDARPHSERARSLLDAEALALKKENSAVLRFGGLYDHTRPIYHEPTRSNEDKLVHFLHRADAAAAILHTIVRGLTGIYNVHDGNPQTRSEIMRRRFGFEMDIAKATARRISAEKFANTGFQSKFHSFFTGVEN